MSCCGAVTATTTLTGELSRNQAVRPPVPVAPHPAPQAAPLPVAPHQAVARAVLQAVVLLRMFKRASSWMRQLGGLSLTPQPNPG